MPLTLLYSQAYDAQRTINIHYKHTGKAPLERAHISGNTCARHTEPWRVHLAVENEQKLNNSTECNEL